MNTILLYFTNLILTSLLICLADRSITNQALLTRRSYCFSCKAKLAWYDLIPVWSVLWNRGHCRQCQQIYAQPVYLAAVEALVPAAGTWLFFHNSWLDFFLFYLLFLLAWEDGHSLSCSAGLAWLTIPLLCFVSGPAILAQFPLLFFLTILLTYLSQKQLLGTGDIPIILTSFLSLDQSHFAQSLLIASLTALIYLQISKHKRLPLVPFLFMAWFLVHLY